MTAAEILSKLSRLGVVATATPDGYLDLEPASNLTSEILETVKAHKPAILKHLTSTNTSTELMPVESPWLGLSDNAQDVWQALENAGTNTLHLIDQDGRKCCHAFTASKPSDLIELARRGLKTWPRVQRLTVIAVLPKVTVWQLETRRIN